MKIYFLVIIIILVVVIILLFYLIYKIYILHVKSYEDAEYEEDEEAHLSIADEVDAGSVGDPVQSSQDSLSSKTGSTSSTSAVQPNIKTMPGPFMYSVSEDFKTKNGAKEKCSVTVSLQYVPDQSKLLVDLADAANLPKAKSGSSEAYVDMQVTPYKHRTYRPPGYRRPLRGCLKKSIDFSLEVNDLGMHYFILYLLRYDPFSRLKVEGEIKIPLSELDDLLHGETVTLTKELVDSKQQFTGFIFRHGNGSTRSLNGSTRSTNGSPMGVRRSIDDSTRASSRSFDGFSRALDESSFRRSGSVHGSNGVAAQSVERSRKHSRSFNGIVETDDITPLGLKRSQTDRPRRKRYKKLHDSPLARKDS